jgi:hypothetical protein
LVLPSTLVVAKCKQLVFPDCAAKRATELALSEDDRLFPGLTGWVVRMGIKFAAPAEEERTTVHLVRSRLDAGLNDGAATAPKLRRRDTGVYTKFLNSLGWRKEDNGVDETIIVVNAIENKVVGLRA